VAIIARIFHADTDAACPVPVPLRKFSQNWLANDELAAALVRSIEPRPGDHFLEIGAGDGRLTRALLEHPVTVTAIELDRRCCAALGELAEETARRATGARLTIIEGDVLEVDLSGLSMRPEPQEPSDRSEPPGPSDLSEPPGQPGPSDLSEPSGSSDRPTAPAPGNERIRFVGNLPYALASPILRWTVKHRRLVADAHYMLPAEVAERLTAPPGSSARGLLTVLMGWFFDAEVVRKLGPGAFRPPPKIDSAFLRLSPHPPPACAAPPAHRRAVVQAAFAQRRKTLVRALINAGWERQAVEAALEAAATPPRARAEDLDVAQFARLAEALPELTGRGEDGMGLAP
jgi:16S rRNA (adenine1518-N6/adenine1519-N6)-dimethyltransferase